MRITFALRTSHRKGIVENLVAVALGGCLVCLSPATGFAQYSNTVLDGSGQDHSPSVAVHRKNPQNIVVATAGGGMYRSEDGGNSWEKGEFNRAEANYGANVLVAERKGDLYNFHLSGADDGSKLDRIVCQMSKDAGKSWTVVGSTSSTGADVRLPGIGMNTRSGEFLLLWTQFDQYGSDDEAHKSRIMLAQSKDGKKWSYPVRVSQEGDCTGDDLTPQGGKAVVSKDGYMVSAWAYDQKLYVDRSFDKGRTWLSNDIEAAKQPGGCVLDIPGLSAANGLPTLLIDQSSARYAGILYLIWADQKNGEEDTDIWCSRSHNYGDNWTTPVRVNDDEKGSHQFMPAAVLDQSTGKMYIVYYDRRRQEDELTDVYLAYSADQGTTFKNVKLSESPFQPDLSLPIGEYTGIDASGGVIVPAWTRMDDGASSVVVTVVRDSDLVTETTEK